MSDRIDHAEDRTIRPTSRSRLLGAVTALALVPFAPGGAGAADSCRIYSGSNQSGSSQVYDLPGIDDTYSPVWWSTSSRRAIGEELDVPGSAVYENAESIRLVAGDTAVSFVAYTGNNMDGVFQVVHCDEGHTCNWTFGSMKNQLRSFDCQRDLAGPEIPTVSIADGLTEQIHANLQAKDDIDTTQTKYGRLAWTNVRARCERTGVGCGGTWQDKYKDVLEYVGKFGIEPHPAGWYKQYDVWFTFWMNPELFGSNHEFRVEETFYQIKVEEGVVQQQLLDKLENGIQPLFDGAQDLGEQVTASIWDAVIQKAHEESPTLNAEALAAIVMRGNQRIYPHYACAAGDFSDNRPESPGFTYSAYLQGNPCGYGMPTYAYPPLLNLVKSF